MKGLTILMAMQNKPPAPFSTIFVMGWRGKDFKLVG